MLIDNQTVLMDGFSVPADATTVSTNSIDTLGAATAASNQVQGATTDTLGNTPINDVGRSDVELLFQVTETFTGGTSVRFDVITSAAANLGSPTILCSTPVIAEASLVAGYRARLAVPMGSTQRYFGVQVVGVGTHTTGQLTCAVLHGKTSVASNGSLG